MTEVNLFTQLKWSIFSFLFCLSFLSFWISLGQAKELNNSEKLALSIPVSALAYSAYIKDYEGMVQLGYTFFSVLQVTELVKHTADKPRPGDHDGYSFPSGHTSTAFSGAAYWQMRYGWKVGVPMYTAAALVGYSRVNTKAHRWIEVFAGAALGYIGGLIFTEPYVFTALGSTVNKKQGFQLSLAPRLELDQKKYLGLEFQVLF